MSNTSTTPVAPLAASRGAPMAVAVTSIREFLAFKLGSEKFGIDILRVQAIRSYEPPTRMAQAPTLQ